MNLSFRLFCFSTALLCLAWIAKLQFIFGGDYLFRIGTAGIVVSLLIQLFITPKNKVIREFRLTKMFIINLLSLLIVYTGMMLKVAHIMKTQFEKDLVLDFIGIPAIITSVIYSYAHIGKIMNSDKEGKLLFLKYILFPWTIFFISFLLYTVYSAILMRAVVG